VEVIDDGATAKGEMWVQGEVIEYDEDAGLVCVAVNGETQYICEEEGSANIRAIDDGSSDTKTVEAARGGEDVPEHTSAASSSTQQSEQPPPGPRNPTINGQVVTVSGEIYTKKCNNVENPPEDTQVEDIGEPIVEGLGLAFNDPNYDTKPWTIIYANLKYQTLREGDPHAECKLPISMAQRTTATVKAEAWMKSKKDEKESGKFWSTREAGHCFTYKAGAEQVVKGWDKGCEGMRVGEIRRLHVPSNLAYGSKGNKEYEIPPNNDLVFEVECMYVRRFA